MPRYTWTLCDTKQSIYHETFEFRETLTIPGEGANVSVGIVKRRLQGGLSDGVDVVEIDNGRLVFTVLLTRGMGIWRVACRREAPERSPVELKWNSPIHGPVHPHFVPLSEPSGLGWLDGFDEWFVRCGLESNGAAEHDEHGVLRYGLHGRIANTPADQVVLSLDTDTCEITLAGTVRESRLFFKNLELNTVYTTRFGARTLDITDTVSNRARTEGAFQLLYHINTGRPLAAPGASIVVPNSAVTPKNAVAEANLPEWNRCGVEEPGRSRVFSRRSWERGRLGGGPAAQRGARRRRRDPVR